MNLDGYIRVSRVAGRSGENFISPKVQRDKIQALATIGGHTIVKWHEDLDQSGAKSDRPGFQDALTRVETSKTDGIAVAKLDRFSRSVSDTAQALKRIREADGAFLSAEDGFDTSTPIGRFAMHMMIAMAELEWERRRESWQIARSEAVSRGVHVSSMPPAGYDRGPDGRLVPNQDAEAVTEVFRAKAKGSSWTELGKILEDAGAVTNRGAVFWTPRTLQNILSNRVYLGEARSGEFVNPDGHEPLIDEATWQLAQFREVRNSPANGESLLTGILRCAGCRYTMTPDRMVLKSGPNKGTKARIYRCRGKRSSGRCQAPASVMARVIEPHVENLFLESLDFEGAQQVQDRADLDGATLERDKAAAEVDAYLALDIAEVIGVDRYRQGLVTRQGRLDAAEAAVAELQDRLNPDVLTAPEIREAWDRLSNNEKRELISSGIDTVFLRRSPHRGTFPIADRTRILRRGEAPRGLPSVRNRPLSITPYEW